MNKKSKNLFVFTTAAVFLTLAIIACKKEAAETTPNQVTTKSAFQYDETLLQEFRGYQAKIGSGNVFRSSANAKTLNQPFRKNPVLEKLVDNYLRYQADSLIKKKQTDVAEGNVAQLNSCNCGCGGGGGGGSTTTTMPVSGVANITGTGNSILLQVRVDPSNQIVSSSYSIGGLHGTVTQIGVIEQTTVNCTNTFKMYLSGTWSYTNGTNANYTTNVMVYGNIYNGQMALGGMVYDPPVE